MYHPLFADRSRQLTEPNQRVMPLFLLLHIFIPTDCWLFTLSRVRAEGPFHQPLCNTPVSFPVDYSSGATILSIITKVIDKIFP